MDSTVEQGQRAHHMPLAEQAGGHSLQGGQMEGDIEEHSLLGSLGVGGRFQVGQLGAEDSFREELVDGDRCPEEPGVVGQGVQESFLNQVDEKQTGEGEDSFAGQDRRSSLVAVDSQDSCLSISEAGRWVMTVRFGWISGK